MRARLSCQGNNQAMTFENLTCGLLWLFIFATPFELRLAVGGVSLPGLLGYASLAAGLLGVIWTSKLVKPSLGYLLLLAFCLWSTISIAWSDYPDRTFSKVLIYWGLLGFVALVTQYASARHIRQRMLGAYVIGCWCGVLSVLYSFISGTQYKESGRYSSAFGDPNFLALALVIGIPIACYLVSQESHAAKKVLFIAYVPAAIASIVVTGSRGAALSLLASSLVLGILAVRKIRLHWVLAAVAACLVVVYALPPDAMGRLGTIPDELQNGSLSGRRTYWDAGMPLLEAHPMRGLGAGAGDGFLSSTLGIEKVFHSTPLEVAIDGGAVGVLLFYGALVCGLVSVWKSDYMQRAFSIAVCAAWLVGSFSLSWELHKVTWFLLGLIVSATPEGRLARSPMPSMTTQGNQYDDPAIEDGTLAPLDPGVGNLWN
jgi:O-antigen ligase